MSTTVVTTTTTGCCCPPPTDCCTGHVLPATLTATVTAPWCAAIDGAVFTITWNGVDKWYGEFTPSCTNCDRFYVSLQCVGGVFVETFAFFSSDPGARPCVNPDPGPGCTLPTLSTPFDCVALTASASVPYGLIDVVSGTCCSPAPSVCQYITVDITP